MTRPSPTEFIIQRNPDAQPDSFGRVRFTAYWYDPTVPAEGGPPDQVRGQVFFADPNTHIEQAQADGMTVHIIDTAPGWDDGSDHSEAVDVPYADLAGESAGRAIRPHSRITASAIGETTTLSQTLSTVQAWEVSSQQAIASLETSIASVKRCRSRSESHGATRSGAGVLRAGPGALPGRSGRARPVGPDRRPVQLPP